MTFFAVYTLYDLLIFLLAQWSCIPGSVRWSTPPPRLKILTYPLSNYEL